MSGQPGCQNLFQYSTFSFHNALGLEDRVVCVLEPFKNRNHWSQMQAIKMKNNFVFEKVFETLPFTGRPYSFVAFDFVVVLWRHLKQKN